MLPQVFLTLAFAALSLAYHIVSPNSQNGWTNQGCQDVKWERVKTDAAVFDAVLKNVETGETKVIATSVDGSLGKKCIPSPDGGWPKGDQFELSFVRDAQHQDHIYAQSEEFKIYESPTSPGQMGMDPGPDAAFSMKSKPSLLAANPPETGTNAAPPVLKFSVGAVGFLLGVWAVVIA
ncbi:hypothetical protein ONZ45_g12294 [Pleurotus djamor]|nr:hypothetical protein ONZ45_g12294 [Pleurotus djamor]